MLGEVEDVETLRRALQALQYDGLRYAVEANRRRKWQNSGSLPWQFNEPYPMAACTSAVDYFGQPKPVYYGVRQAYSPVHVSARFARQAWAGQEQFEAEVWASSSLERAFREARAEAALVGFGGHRYASSEGSGEVAANAASLLLAVDWPLAQVAEDVFFLDLHLWDASDQVLAKNRYVLSRTTDLRPLLSVLPTQLTVRADIQGGQEVLAIRNAGDQSALFVWLEEQRPLDAPGYVYFADNYFSLLPGEERLVAVDWDGVPPEERSLRVQAWNTGAVVVGG
jgi:beta-mannosidase